MMQFVQDTQAQGRFFPRGARVQAIAAGSTSLVLPDPEAHTTLCAVPARNLVRLQLFRVLLVNRCVGLADAQLRWGLDADEVLSTLAQGAPDCEVIGLERVMGAG